MSERIIALLKSRQFQSDVPKLVRARDEHFEQVLHILGNRGPAVPARADAPGPLIEFCARFLEFVAAEKNLDPSLRVDGASLFTSLTPQEASIASARLERLLQFDTEGFRNFRAANSAVALGAMELDSFNVTHDVRTVFRDSNVVAVVPITTLHIEISSPDSARKTVVEVRVDPDEMRELIEDLQAALARHERLIGMAKASMVAAPNSPDEAGRKG